MRPGGLDAVANRDLIVIGSLRGSRRSQRLLQDGPITVEGNRLNVALPDTLENFRNIFLSDDRRLQRERLTATLGGTGEGGGLLIGARSPLNADRSVVAVTGSTPQGDGGDGGRAARPRNSCRRSRATWPSLANGRMESFKVSRNFSVGSLPVTLMPQRYPERRGRT